MDPGQAIFILCQLILGAAAALLAIILWSRIRDAAWMFIVFGIIVTYIEIIHYILKLFGAGIGGILDRDFFYIGSVPVISFLLPLLRMSFFIAAFLIMLIKSRSK